jgi:uncharacterized protein
MIALITDNLDAIAKICDQHGFQKLKVFGSAATGCFEPQTSDIDLVVDFTDYGPGIADRFFCFSEAIESLMSRPVDLVFARELTNPFFREAVNETRVTIYEARDGKVAA